MNRGILNGLAPTTWRRFNPKVVVVNSSPSGSGLTQPFFDTFNGRFQFGRYMRVEGLVVVQAQVSFVGSTTIGAGGPYALQLPVPARRAVPDVQSLLPIGTAMAYFSTVEPFVNVGCCATLADPWASLNGDHDSYAQFYTSQITSWGLETGWTPTTAKTVTHQLGFTPSAADIIVTPSGYGGTANTNPWWVAGLTSTTFAVHTWSDNGVGGANGAFGWKAIAEPPTGQGGNLVGPGVPFDWGRFTAFGPFGNFFVELAYEPAT